MTQPHDDLWGGADLTAPGDGTPDPGAVAEDSESFEAARKLEEAEGLLKIYATDRPRWLEAMKGKADPVRQMARVFDAYQAGAARLVGKELLDVERLADMAASRRLRILGGWEFLADEDDEVLSIWGDGDRVAWAPGESLMLFGGNGVFKSTLSHLLIFARLELLNGPDGGMCEVLGMPVVPATGKVMYLAGDRPRQIKRAMRRLRRDWMRDILADRLVVHEGPLPFDITVDKDALADLAESHGVSDIIVDSLKDYCPKPSDDECANGYNRARQECIARGLQWMENHHNRKPQQGQPKTNGIDDVYGSRWLTAGAGSVLGLSTDEEGSPVVQFKQLKSPGEFLPPMIITVDKKAGMMTGDRAMDPITFIRASGAEGVTAAEFARLSGQSVNAARNWLNLRKKQGSLEDAPSGSDKVARFRTVLGVMPQSIQNVYQQDGLGDF